MDVTLDERGQGAPPRDAWRVRSSILATEDYIPFLAPAQEARDRAFRVALEDLARARRAGRAQDVGDLGLARGRLGAVGGAIEAAVFPGDLIDVIRRRPVAPD